jgi:hypothetical protein
MLKRLLAGLLVVMAPAWAAAYTGFKSTEADISFKARIEIETKKKSLPLDEIERAIDTQLEHLLGPMGLSEKNAAPKGERTIAIIGKPKQLGSLITAEYNYVGRFVLENGVKTQYETYLPIRAKIDEDGDFEFSDFYFAGFYDSEGTESEVNLCTDDHYQSLGDYFYFWGPGKLREGCPLISGKHYQTINPELANLKIKRIPNEESSRPEYENLVNNVKDKVVHISILMGMDEPSTASGNPNISKDLNAPNYRALRELLLTPENRKYRIKRDEGPDDVLDGFGFQRTQPGRWSREQVKALMPSFVPLLDQDIPFVEEFEKEYPRKDGSEGPIKKVVIRMFFGQTGFGERTKMFHYFLKDAMANSSILIYDGHSGLGGNINISRILNDRRQADPDFDLAPNPERYQIFFFNSCSSYSYYNTMMFQAKRDKSIETVEKIEQLKALHENVRVLAKRNPALMNSLISKFFKKKKSAKDPKGTKMLDIITTGLETPFDGSARASNEIFRAVHNFAKGITPRGYQKMVKGLTMDNLVGVNGDEDNPDAQD